MQKFIFQIFRLFLKNFLKLFQFTFPRLPTTLKTTWTTHPFNYRQTQLFFTLSAMNECRMHRVYYTKVRKKFASCHHPCSEGVYDHISFENTPYIILNDFEWDPNLLNYLMGCEGWEKIESDYRDFPFISSQVSHIQPFFCWDARDSLEWIFHLILECSVEIASSFTFLLISSNFTRCSRGFLLCWMIRMLKRVKWNLFLRKLKILGWCKILMGFRGKILSYVSCECDESVVRILIFF
jgi:hypothetical protein